MTKHFWRKIRNLFGCAKTSTIECSLDFQYSSTIENIHDSMMLLANHFSKMTSSVYELHFADLDNFMKSLECVKINLNQFFAILPSNCVLIDLEGYRLESRLCTEFFVHSYVIRCPQIRMECPLGGFPWENVLRWLMVPLANHQQQRGKKMAKKLVIKANRDTGTAWIDRKVGQKLIGLIEECMKLPSEECPSFLIDIQFPLDLVPFESELIWLRNETNCTGKMFWRLCCNAQEKEAVEGICGKRNDQKSEKNVIDLIDVVLFSNG